MTEILLCALATAGLVAVAWCLLGLWIVPRNTRDAVYVVRASSDQAARLLRAHLWLTDAGLDRTQAVLVDDGRDRLAAEAAGETARALGAVYCTTEQLEAWLNGGEGRIGTDGAEDPAGDGGGRHLPE
jgi:hypothetical protein